MADPVDALVNALFVSTRMVDNCANVQQYANKLIDGQEDPRTFHKFLPRLLNCVLSPESKQGWVHTVKTEQEAKALVALLSANGPLFRAVLQSLDDQALLYQLKSNKLPAWMLRRLTEVKNGVLDIPAMLHGRTQDQPNDQQLQQQQPPSSPKMVGLGANTMASQVNIVPASSIPEFNVTFNMVEYFLYWLVFVGVSNEDPKKSLLSSSSSIVSSPSGRTGLSSPSSGPTWAKLNQILDVAPSSGSSSSFLASSGAPSLRAIYHEIITTYNDFFLVSSQKPPQQQQPAPVSHPFTPGQSSGSSTQSGQKSSSVQGPATLAPNGSATKPSASFLTCIELGSNVGKRIQTGHYLAEFYWNTISDLWILTNRYEFSNEHRLPMSLTGYASPTVGMIGLINTVIRALVKSSPMTSDINWSLGEQANATVHARKLAYQTLRRPLYESIQLSLAFGAPEIFETVIDGWLMFLEPWKQEGAKFSMDWSLFVLENYLHYVMPLRNLLVRLSQKDLTESNTNMGILNRVFNVFTENERLAELLQDAEHAFLLSSGGGYANPGNNFGGGFGQQVQSSPITRRFSISAMQPELNHPSRINAQQMETLRSTISLTEGRNFEWRPVLLSTANDFKSISDLHGFLSNTIRKQQRSLEAKEALAAKAGSSSSFASFLTSAGGNSPSEKSQQVLQARVSYDRLNRIERSLVLLFPNIPSMMNSNQIFSPAAAPKISLIPDTMQVTSETGGLVNQLSDRGKNDLRRGIKKCSNLDVVAKRVPADRIFVHSYENATLVLLAVRLSNLINAHLPQAIEQVFGAPAPAWTHRVNLRYFAAYSNLVSSVLFVVLGYILVWFVRLFLHN